MKVWLNDVQAYGGLAAVDCYIGATEVAEGDPLNSVYPGEFNYGGGHVIADLVAGNAVKLRVEGYGTDCYPARRFEKNITIGDLRDAILFNPRNAIRITIVQSTCPTRRSTLTWAFFGRGWATPTTRRRDN